MSGHIIDGERWIAERLRFLRAHLATDLSAADRSAAEEEVRLLSEEHGMGVHGRRTPRLLRRLRRR